MNRIVFFMLLCAALIAPGVADAGVRLHKAGTYSSGVFDESAAEIVAYDRDTSQVFVVNANSGHVDVLDASDITRPRKVRHFDYSQFGGTVNSVACMNGMVAVAVEAKDKQAPGVIVVTDVRGRKLGAFKAGALPDMVTFTPDGKYILAANEGEPNDAYDNDPEGSVTVIDISRGIAKARVRQADFRGFNSKLDTLREKGVRISHPGSTVAQDVEPEYIAVGPDSRIAYVALQENNALAVVDIRSAKIRDILPLGLKDWDGNGWKFDASDKDKRINLHFWPVFGAYMPDAVAAYEVDGKTYIVSANEGDSREYGDYADEIRFGKAAIDGDSCSYAKALQDEKALGRLKVIQDLSDRDGDGDFDRIVAFGGRSFSIWDEDGRLVYDSGDEFEHVLAVRYPQWFNAGNDKNKFDNRSDDKGCEPEAVAVGVIDGRAYAFIGLERMGGIMVYDVTDPKNPEFVEYRLDRDFSGDPEKGTAGDLGPEGFKFVPASESHTGTNLLIVGSEVSGTTTIYEVR